MDVTLNYIATMMSIGSMEQRWNSAILRINLLISLVLNFFIIFLLITTLKGHCKLRITFNKNIDMNEVRGIRKLQRLFSDYYGIVLPIGMVITMGGILFELYFSDRPFNKARVPFNEVEVKLTNGDLVILYP